MPGSESSRTPLFRYCTALTSLLFVLITDGTALGQRAMPGRPNSGMRLPSLSSPSQTFTQDFGRVGGSLGEEGAVPWGPARIQSPALDSRFQSSGSALGSRWAGMRGRGQGLARPQPFGDGFQAGTSSLFTRRGLLLGRRVGGSAARQGLPTSRTLGLTGWLSGPSVLSLMHTETLSSGPLGLGGNPLRRLSNVNYADWVQPDVAVRSPSRLSSASAVLPVGSAPGEAKSSLEDLVRSNIGSRRDAYLEQGWQFFKKGDYRRAHDMFTLADAARLDDLDARVSVKLALLYAGIASQQYAQAMNALRWLLSPDRKTAQLPDPLFLNRIRDVRSLYGVGEMYSVHVRDLEQFAIQNPAVAGARALHAVALWQRKDDIAARGDALFRARRLASEPVVEEPWGRLHEAMQKAEAASAGQGPADGAESSGSSEPISSLLPFETPVTE